MQEPIPSLPPPLLFLSLSLSLSLFLSPPSVVVVYLFNTFPLCLVAARQLENSLKVNLKW